MSQPLEDSSERPFPWYPFASQDSLLSVTQAKQLSPVALAYIGDSIYEMYVRLHYLLPAKRINLYHKQVVEQVRAEAQAQQLTQLLPRLTEVELEIVRRGRNAIGNKPRRMNLEDYQKSTGFEALAGYLFLTDPNRLQTLWQHIHFEDIG
jgi:ribonuclease-3 family protein